MKIKQTVTPTLLAIALLLTLGCATTGDPVLVGAQKTIVQAESTMDLFVHLERRYESQLKAINPEIHAYAETVRAHGQQWLLDGWSAVESYRLTKDQSRLNQAMAVLRSAMNASQHYIDLANSKGVK